MIRFLIRLAVLCAVGAAVVWFGLPPFKKIAPGPYAQLASILLGRPVSVAGTSQVATGLGENGPDINAMMEKANELGEKAAERAGIPAGAKSAAEVLGNRKKKSAGTNETAVADAAAPAPAPAAGEPSAPSGVRVVYVEEELPPDPRGALNDDPGYPMGVVVTNSFYYDARGHRLGTMPGGTAVENLETVQMGDTLVCKTLVFHPKKSCPSHERVLAGSLSLPLAGVVTGFIDWPDPLPSNATVTVVGCGVGSAGFEWSTVNDAAERSTSTQPSERPG